MSVENTKEQIKKLLGSVPRLLGFLEINELYKNIRKNEKVNGIVQGQYNKHHAILVTTNDRLILINRNFLFGVHFEELGYKDIDSVEFYLGPLFGSIRIITTGKNNIFIRKVLRWYVKGFTQNLRNLIRESVEHQEISDENQDINSGKENNTETNLPKTVPRKQINTVNLKDLEPNQESKYNFIDKLERIQKLRDAGILTDEEVKETKKRILDN